MMATHIAVDPGKSGAIVAIRHSGEIVSVDKMPQTESGVRDLFETIVRLSSPRSCYIEWVHSMPKQGVASSFKFGKGYGGVRMAAICNHLRIVDVTPRRWQKALNCLTGGDKNITKDLAQKMFPRIKVTHALADALLLAEYARRCEIEMSIL